MHITNVKINGFYSHVKSEINFDDTTNIIVGTNGSGKSLFFKCIEEVLKTIINEKTNLDEHCSSKQESYIKITIKFNNNEINVLNAILFIMMVNKYRYNNEDYDKIWNKIEESKLFTNGIIINYLYFSDVDRFDSIIKFINNDCDCKYKTHFDVKCTYYELINFKLNNSEYSNDHEKYNKIQKYILNHFKSKLDFKIDIINKINYSDNVKNTECDILNVIKKISSCNDDFLLKYMSIYIYNSILHIKNEKNMYVIEILNYLIEYENNSNNGNFTLNRIINNKNIYDFISKINVNYKKKEKLFELFNINSKLFNKISEKFYEITNKKFVINYLINEHKINDYDYFIEIDDNKKYDCSLGEYELINFLFDYYNDESDVIFIDEPCTHLSSQNKIKLKKIINDKNKQLILITHDIELIEEYSKIFYFSNINDSTIIIDLDEIKLNEKSLGGNVVLNTNNGEINMNEFNEKKAEINNYNQNLHVKKIYNNENYKIKKNIYDNKQILFVDNVLIVEGYEDYIFIKCFLDVHNIYNYCVCINDSKTNKTLIKLCKTLKIKYKILFDYDVLYKNENDYDKKNICGFCIMSDIIINALPDSEIKTLNECKDYTEIIRKLKNNGVYIWNNDIIEIEGIKFKIFEKDLELMNDNKYNYNNYKSMLEQKCKDYNTIMSIKDTNKILCDIFKKKSLNDIKNAIVKNINNNDLNDLLNFLKND